MSQRILVSSVLLLGAFQLPFCGQVNIDTNTLARKAVEGGVEATRESKEAYAKCDALAGKPIAFEEERAIGGAVAVSFANQSAKHMMIDVPAGESADLAKKPPKEFPVPKGEKRDLNVYVNVVGQNLAAMSTRPTLAWTFGVLDDPSPNAFSAPGGYVFITRGLLTKLDNESQLAGVLAHEIGHVTERHALNLYSGVKVTQCRAGAIAKGAVTGARTTAGAIQVAGPWGEALNLSTGFLDLDNMTGAALAKIIDPVIDKVKSGFAADDEFGADRVAIELTVAAGYNPHEYGKLIQKLPESTGMFANHPKNADRLTHITAELTKLQPGDDSFGYSFDKNPVVPFKDELKAAK